MSISKKVDVRIYEPQISQIDRLINQLNSNPNLFGEWVDADKKQRDNYNNYSGKKATAKGLLLRRALSIGLHHLENEITKGVDNA